MAAVDIVGGGLFGLMLARGLLQHGIGVRVWERERTPGGLMRPARLAELGDVEVDRSYRPLHSADRATMALLEDLGLRHSVHSGTTRRGIFYDGEIYPLNSARDLLFLAPLSPLQRARVALAIMAARHVLDQHALEQLTALEWLARIGGHELVARLWEPLLRARFDAEVDALPAARVQGHLAHTAASTAGDCYLPGGTAQIITALVEDITRRGGEIYTGVAVQQVRVDENRTTGLLVGGQELGSEVVVLTAPTPVARRLLPAEAAFVGAGWARLEEYLSALSVIVALRRSLTRYHTLVVADKNLPFSTVVEATNLIELEDSGGYHLVYLPKYIAASSLLAEMDDIALRKVFVGFLLQMFPDITAHDIAAVRVDRERYAEPLHPVGRTQHIPALRSAVQGLYLANSAQIYPDPVTIETIIAYAGKVAGAIAREPEVRAAGYAQLHERALGR